MFKVCLISDIHFGVNSRSLDFGIKGEPLDIEIKLGKSLKESLIDTIKIEKADYLVVAGDLTSTGNPLEFKKCKEVLLDIACQSGIKEERVLVTLGNHDVDWRIRKIPENNEFKKKKKQQDFPFLELNSSYQNIASNIGAIIFENLHLTKKGPAPLTGLYEDSNMMLYILNSSWKCNHDKEFQSGFLDEDQLDWFNRHSKEDKGSHTWKILLIHHHPRNYPTDYSLTDNSCIKEGANLVQIASKNAVDAIIHGHRHNPYFFTIQESSNTNPLHIACSGSLSVNVKERGAESIPNTVHFLEFCNDKDRDNCKYIFLKNYQFHETEGWIPMKPSRSKNAMEHEMILYKQFTNDAICDKLSTYMKEESFIIPSWKNLSLELRTLKYFDLLQLAKDYFSKHDVRCQTNADDEEYITCIKRIV